MISTKDIDITVHDYIYPWGEILDSVVWAITAYYYRTLGFTPGQAVFGIDMLFNLTSIAD